MILYKSFLSESMLRVKGKSMENDQYTKAITSILGTGEALFGDHPRWDYFRKRVLRSINDLRRINNYSSKRLGQQGDDDYGREKEINSLRKRHEDL